MRSASVSPTAICWREFQRMVHNPSAKSHFEETGHCIWLCNAGFSDLIRILAVPSLFLSLCQRETPPRTNHGVEDVQLCQHKPPVKRKMRVVSQALPLGRVFLYLRVLLLIDFLFWGETICLVLHIWRKLVRSIPLIVWWGLLLIPCSSRACWCTWILPVGIQAAVTHREQHLF